MFIKIIHELSAWATLVTSGGKIPGGGEGMKWGVARGGQWEGGGYSADTEPEGRQPTARAARGANKHVGLEAEGWG